MNNTCGGNCSTGYIALKIRNAPQVYIIENNYGVNPGEYLVANTERGKELAYVYPSCSKELTPIGGENFIKEITGKATEAEVNTIEEYKDKEIKALEDFRQKVEKHELPMKVIEVYYLLDKSKIMFYYYAENKVDFRKLVRELAGVYKTRIEMRQVGIRDEAKMRGGLGPCGLVTCCKKFLYDFESISMKMAKDQEIMLNPSKISGICGRLMCCLKYEQNFYTKAKEDVAPVGSIVEIAGKSGKVTMINSLKNIVYVEFDDKVYENYDIQDFIKKAKIIKLHVEEEISPKNEEKNPGGNLQ
ncbi:MAG: regulatory iron-sulfur-containing complex subunit RicT [Candidatus Muiribacteriota bacterium]